MIEEKEKGPLNARPTPKGTTPDPPIAAELLVSAWGIVLLITYFIALSILLLHGLVQFLPEKAATEIVSSSMTTVTYLWWNIAIGAEVRLFITVALAGSLGSLVHALRSLYWYIGNRALVRSWIPKYILMPFVGATLGVAFYFVIRGGFFSAGSNVNQTNPYGFIAVGVLIGMFSEQAVLKLKDVAETLLAKPQPGEDAKPESPPEGSKPNGPSPSGKEH